MKRKLIFSLISLMTITLLGCYSFTASTLPSHIRTVRISEIDNKTLDPVLGNEIQAGVQELFRKNAGKVRLVNGEADADFDLTLLSYSNKPENFNSADEVETYRVSIRVAVKFYDNVKERVIYEAKSLSAEGVYDVLKNETEERHGQERAIEKMQDLIITNALAKW